MIENQPAITGVFGSNQPMQSWIGVCRMKLIQWTDTDAYFNLAAEEYVFDRMDRTEEYLLLWQNRNAIVVGKHQNTVEEVNAQYVQEHGVQVVRRLSGGGAVYHDMGNLNFTIIGDAEGNKFNFQKLSQPIVQTLGRMGAEVQFSGRNDLLMDGRKISGNAQFVRGSRLLHHGTLLFHSDLDMISNVLTVKGDKIESKGVKSVRSRVTNINDHAPNITIPDFKALLEETLLKDRDIQHYVFTETDRAGITALRENKYSTWEWNYGRSPEYDIRKERRFSGGGVCLYMRVNEGVIQSIRIMGDYFGDGEIEDLENRLVNVKLNEQAVHNALEAVEVGFFIHGMTVEELVQIIVH